MLWLKVFHLFALISWFAGTFYLPRLFVYHAMSEDQASRERFKIMERKLLWGIMTPSAVLTVGLGIALWLWLGYGFDTVWLNIKLGLVGLLLVYNGWCIKTVQSFKADQNKRSHQFFRWMNEIPVILLLGILIMVVVKPIW